MESDEVQLQPKDLEKIRMAVLLHVPIEITTYTLPRKMELYIHRLMEEFFKECHQEHMTESLKFCLGELLTNSKKANTKRVYFQEKNLDINNEMQYNDGMFSFKNDTLVNINHYLHLQKDQGYYIKLSLKVDDDNVTIEIRNNAVLTKGERRRILEKMNTAKHYDTVQDAIGRIIDQTEGAGLGIIIIILMLQKLGISNDNFTITTTDTETVTKMNIPVNPEYLKGLYFLCDEYVLTQDQIPVLSENYEKMCALVKDVEPDVERIKELLSQDVTLLLLLLKKASEMGSKPRTITKALEVVGIENLRSVYNHANPFVNIITDKEKESIWSHAYKTAYCAYNIVQNFYPDQLDSEEVFVAALFHDIGNLFLKTTQPEVFEHLKKRLKEKEYPEQSFSQFEGAGKHNYSGKYILEKFGVNDTICKVAEYHNQPEVVPEEERKIVYSVYLADIIQYYKTGIIEFYQIDKKVLDELGIYSEEELKYIVKQLETVISL